MAMSIPQDRDTLQPWLRRLYEILSNLRALDARKKQILSQCRALIEPKIALGPVEKKILTLALIGVLVLLFYVVVNGAGILIFGIVLVAVSYSITKSFWKQSKSGHSQELLVVISGKTFVARQVVVTLLISNVLLFLIQVLGGGGPVVALIVTGVAIGLALVLAPICVWVLQTRATQFNARAEKQNREIAAQNKPFEEQALAVSQNISQLANELQENYLSVFPKQYLDEEIVGYLLNLVTNYRADTLRQAINLYEEEQHRLRMERGQQQIISEQKELKRVQIMSTVINTAMQAATISEIRNQGQRIASAASAPRTITVKRG